MPRTAVGLLSEGLLEAARYEAARYIDLGVELHDKASGQVMLAVGGRWDRKLKRWAGEARQVRVLELHPGQLDAARACAAWITRYSAGEPADEFSYLLAGGRRGGKTVLSMMTLVCLAVAFHGSVCWAVAPTVDETAELQRWARAILPPGWYRAHVEPPVFRLVNGSTIHFLGAGKPGSLKRGRCDFAVINEGQKIAKTVFVSVRGATVDAGGLTLIAANPPDTKIGRWVAEYAEEANAGKRAGRMFLLDPFLNPDISQASLAALKAEVDAETWLREARGEFIPLGDRAAYNFSPRQSVAPAPQVGDVTGTFTQKHFGRAYAAIVGIDVQTTPMVAVILRAFADPGADDDPILWATDEVVLEQANEEDLIDGLEARGYQADSTVIVIDASCFWQDAERTKGRGSVDVFRGRGWRNVFPPDTKVKRNPHGMDRLRVLNARLKTADGRRHLFVAPECVHLVRALANWENTEYGEPSRQSEHSHACDALAYPLWRFYPRRHSEGGVGYKRLEKPHREDVWGGRGL